VGEGREPWPPLVAVEGGRRCRTSGSSGRHGKLRNRRITGRSGQTTGAGASPARLRWSGGWKAPPHGSVAGRGKPVDAGGRDGRWIVGIVGGGMGMSGERESLVRDSGGFFFQDIGFF
jgi:hypothetical protein